MPLPSQLGDFQLGGAQLGDVQLTAGLPGAPTGVTAVKGNAAATVSFTAPADDGGSAITGYLATASTGQTQAGTSSPITITGLANGVPVSITVHAINGNGSGAESSSSNTVTPSTVPGVPSGVSAVAGDGSITVSFSAPADGGAAIDLYRVTLSGGATLTGPSSPITVTGQTNGVAQTATVAAHNTNGYGSESGASSSVTPMHSDVITLLVRTPYFETDTIGTKRYTVYTVVGGVATVQGTPNRTSGFALLPNLSKAWLVSIDVTPNGPHGDFYGFVVFDNINGASIAVPLHRPPTSPAESLTVCMLTPFYPTDTAGTPGYQLYNNDGTPRGSHVTSGFAAIPGITNGYAVNITVSPDALGGACIPMEWDG